jgi:hypothetical protein
MDEKLNLTADEKDDEIDINDKKLEKEFQNFMQNLQGTGDPTNVGGDPMDQISNLMTGLFKEMNEESKQQAPNENSMNDSIKKVFEKLENNP